MKAAFDELYFWLQQIETPQYYGFCILLYKFSEFKKALVSFSDDFSQFNEQLLDSSLAAGYHFMDMARAFLQTWEPLENMKRVNMPFDEQLMLINLPLLKRAGVMCSSNLCLINCFLKPDENPFINMLKQNIYSERAQARGSLY